MYRRKSLRHNHAVLIVDSSKKELCEKETLAQLQADWRR